MESGFVVRVDRRLIERIRSCVVQACDDATWCRGSWFDIFARPLVATPEGGGEKQPIIVGSTIVVYEGHIDNRREVGRSLQNPALEVAGDGSVLMEAYRRWGEDLSNRVVGEYCYAIIDCRRGRVVAGRDALGVRRLYVMEANGCIRISSSLSLLLSDLPETPSFDLDGIAEYLHVGFVGTERTIYEGLRLVPPGFTLVCDRGDIQRQASWRPKIDEELRFQRQDDYDECLRSLLFESVNAALRSNGPVCTELSGGLDSSTVTSIVGLLGRNGEITRDWCSYSIIASKNTRSDESWYQERVAEAHNIRRYVIDADMHPAFGAYDMEVPAEPLMYIGNPIDYNGISEFAREQRIRTCLTGEGGDLVFGGDYQPPHFLHDWLITGRWCDWGRGLRDYVRAGDYSLWSLLRISSGVGWNPDATRRPPRWLTPDFRKRVGNSWRYLLSGDAASMGSAARALQFRLIRRNACSWRPKSNMWDERHPLLYRPLVEFMLRVPWELKVSPFEDRVLHRRALRGILPESIRKRTGKTPVEASICRGLGRNWRIVEPLSRGKHLANLGIVDPQGFHRACVLLRHGYFETFALPWGALVMERWFQLGGPNAIRERRAQYDEYVSANGRRPGVVVRLEDAGVG